MSGDVVRISGNYKRLRNCGHDGQGSFVYDLETHGAKTRNNSVLSKIHTRTSVVGKRCNSPKETIPIVPVCSAFRRLTPVHAVT